MRTGKTNKKECKNNEAIRRSLWHNFRHTNICIMGVLEGEKREQEIENLVDKIVMKNFPNLPWLGWVSGLIAGL